MRHDPALCTLNVCGRCDAYGDGYSRGKSKSYQEIKAVLLNPHGPDCGCQPCLVVKSVVEPPLAAPGPPRAPPKGPSPSPKHGKDDSQRLCGHSDRGYIAYGQLSGMQRDHRRRAT